MSSFCNRHTYKTGQNVSQLFRSEMKLFMRTFQVDSNIPDEPRDPRVEPRDPRVEPRDPCAEPRDQRVEPRDPCAVPRIRRSLDQITSKTLTMNDMDRMMPSFGTYIRALEADREKLCAKWGKPRERLPPPCESSEPPIPVKIKYCDELTCSVPSCNHSEHEGHIQRTKCGCGCPE